MFATMACSQPAPCDGLPLATLLSCPESSSLPPHDTTTQYRLGDMISQPKHRARADGAALHLRAFPTSIAAQYLRRTNASDDLDVLDRILVRRRRETEAQTNACSLPPADDTLVVHLRLGDVLDTDLSNEALTPWQRNRTLKYARMYTRSAEHYVAALHKVMSTSSSSGDIRPRRIVLVGSTQHCPGCRSNVSLVRSQSFAHLMSVHDALSRALIAHERQEVTLVDAASTSHGEAARVTIRLNFDADDDFAYVSRARFFVCSAGGFSRLLGRMVSRRAALGRATCVCELSPPSFCGV